MSSQKGNISINAENMFPIIKKWLYSDKDIFLREIVSNACDAIHKMKRLDALGEAELPEGTKFAVHVEVDKEAGTIKVIDNGIGMTHEEVEKYITEVAFSSAEEFVSKYKDSDDENGGIIGHFGLGFYSTFMVSDQVTIETLSYKDGATPVKWVCDGGMEYEIGETEKEGRGTTLTLKISEDSQEMLEFYTLRNILTKYCSFLPVEIFIKDCDAEREKEKEVDDKKDEEQVEDVPTPINETTPLWMKKPSECTDEEYKSFYQKVFMDYNEPLFWIHLNVDYPFNLKGILFFPKLRNEMDNIEGQIKLYNNQVFVADNIKEVIPEFLLLLKGIIDCPDLPLNVSRSFLQNDGFVKKISAHITKKVADKLVGMYKNDRESYEKYWDDINPFIKFGCMRDDKFYDRMKDVIIFKNLDDKYTIIGDYLDACKEKHENTVYYISDPHQQAQYINMFKEHEMDAIYLDSIIDNNFVTFYEMKQEGVNFKRIDSDISDALKDKEEVEEDKKISAKVEKIFKKALGENESLKFKTESLKTSGVPAMILVSEEGRRMQEMMERMGGGMAMPGMPGIEETLVVNANNSLIKKVVELNKDKERKDDVALICKQVYDLAQLSNKPLQPEQMTDFIARSSEILEKLV